MANQQDQNVSNTTPSNFKSEGFKSGEMNQDLKKSGVSSSEESLSAANEDQTSDLEMEGGAEMEAGAESDMETEEGFADAEMEIDGAGFNAAKNTERNPRH